MYYAFIENGKINGCGEVRCVAEGVQNIEITDAQAAELDKYMYQNGEIVLDPDYDAKQAEKAKQEQIKALIEQLDVIDLKTIRSLRALQSGPGTQEDTDKLAQLEAQAIIIREQIKELSK